MFLSINKLERHSLIKLCREYMRVDRDKVSNKICPYGPKILTDATNWGKKDNRNLIVVAWYKLLLIGKIAE